MFPYPIYFVFILLSAIFSCNNSTYYSSRSSKKKELTPLTIKKSLYKQMSEYTSVDFINHEQFMEAVKKGETEKVEKHLKAGINPNSRILDDPVNGSTALMNAINNEKTMIAKLLLERGADPNSIAKNSQIGGITALMIAAIKGSVEIVELLIQYNANINAKTVGDASGSTALMAAVGSQKEEIVKKLIEIGADVNITTSNKNISGITALMLAAETGNEKIIQSLLDAPEINISTEDCEQKNALVYAYIAGNIRIIELFINAGLTTPLSPQQLKNIIHKYL